MTPSRRSMLGLLGLGAALALTGCGSDGPDIPPPVAGPASPIARSRTPTRRVALTVDDGYSDETVAAYVQLAHDSGLPLTFDPIAKLAPVWEKHAPSLKPLIEKGQVQIANHTFHHLTLTQLDDAQVRREIESNEQWIQKTFGVTSRPYMRPPSGLRDARTDGIAGDLGFTRILMWQGSFGDATLLPADRLLANARDALLPGAIVVGHANVGTVVDLYPELMAIIRERQLVPSTLDEMFGTSRAEGRA